VWMSNEIWSKNMCTYIEKCLYSWLTSRRQFNTANNKALNWLWYWIASIPLPCSQYFYTPPIVTTLPYTSHPHSIFIHLPSSHSHTHPILTAFPYTSHPHNTPIHLPSSHLRTPPVFTAKFCKINLNIIFLSTCQQLGAKVRNVTGG
jgi:hypothetical protein